MGVMAESMVAYAQPLFDETDGSCDQMQRAFSIAQMCWNLALLPETEQEEMLAEMRAALKLDDAAFADFRETVIAPMIVRHHDMFPNMPRFGGSGTQPVTPESRTLRDTAVHTERYPGTGRNAPCPCNSGRKYKRCCGQ